MMLDKKQIRVIFLFEFKMSHKAEDTTRNINKHLAQELLMNIQCSSGSGSFAKETRALRIRSISQFSYSIVSDSATSGIAACQASFSISSSQSLLKFMSIKSVMPFTISSSVVPFSSSLQSFPASGSFPMSEFFTSSGQSIGASA